MGHLCAWTSGASQGFPPFTGGGLVHERVLFLSLPQRRHSDHEDQSDKPPSTEKEHFTSDVSLIEEIFWLIYLFSVTIDC